MNMFTDIVEIIWREDTVKLIVAELVEGEPDGRVGFPLVIDERSKIFEVILSGVVEFKSVSEPCFHLDGEKKKINDFVFEAIDSEYRKTACPFILRTTNPYSRRHFVIYTETLVFEVLSDTEPIIRIINE